MKNEAQLDELGFIQLLSLVLSILILVGLCVEFLIPLSPAADTLLDRIDFIICLFFLFDFFKRFFAAPSKLEFMINKWGWIDFISSLPTGGILQWGRIARVLRILRVLRLFRSATAIWTHISRNRPKATLKGAILIAIVTFIFGAIAILEVETTNEANIKTPDDALWWAFTNMITVGCEKYPVTELGRVIGGMLSLVGVGLTGVYTAYIASFFISGAAPSGEMTEALAQMRRLADQLQHAVDKTKPPVL